MDNIIKILKKPVPKEYSLSDEESIIQNICNDLTEVKNDFDQLAETLDSHDAQRVRVLLGGRVEGRGGVGVSSGTPPKHIPARGLALVGDFGEMGLEKAFNELEEIFNRNKKGTYLGDPFAGNARARKLASDRKK